MTTECPCTRLGASLYELMSLSELNVGSAIKLKVTVVVLLSSMVMV